MGPNGNHYQRSWLVFNNVGGRAIGFLDACTPGVPQGNCSLTVQSPDGISQTYPMPGPNPGPASPRVEGWCTFEPRSMSDDGTVFGTAIIPDVIPDLNRGVERAATFRPASPSSPDGQPTLLDGRGYVLGGAPPPPPAPAPVPGDYVLEPSWINGSNRGGLGAGELYLHDRDVDGNPTPFQGVYA